jgi:hypothetical protein
MGCYRQESVSTARPVLLHNYVIDRSAEYLWRDQASSPAILNDYCRTLSLL